MTKRFLAALLLVILAALAAAPAADAKVAAPRHSAVAIVVLTPYLRWNDVVSGYMPATQALAGIGAVANMNVRCLLPDAGEPNPDQGALMLSTGTWSRCDTSAPAAEEASEGIVYPGIATQRRANAGQAVDVVPGTLGQAIVDAGGVTAAIGNGDTTYPSRPAAVAAMDSHGLVRLGDVSTATLETRRTLELPSGGSDRARIAERLAAVLADPAVRRGPSLIVIDPGDLARAHEAAGGGADGLERLGRVEALRRTDGVISDARAELPADGVLILAGSVAGKSGDSRPSGFGTLIVHGAGTGFLTSPSTHREGLVTEADLTATVLDALGVPVPDRVAGAPFSLRPSDAAGSERLLQLTRVDDFMRAVDAVRPSFVERFIDVAVVLLVIVAVLLTLPAVPLPVARLAQFALLAVAAVPAASVAMFAVLRLPATPPLVWGLFAAMLFAIWTLAVAAHATGQPPRAISVVGLFAALVIVIDQLLGAPFSLDGLLSYSPLVGARYFGIGNETAALLVGCAVTGAALLFDFDAERHWVQQTVRFGFPAAALLCLFAAGAPFFGANVGVAVWGTFVFGLAWWGMLGHRIDWRAILTIVLAVVMLIALFAAIDVLSPGGARTHLARAVGAASGDGGSLWLMLQRKVAMNVQMLVGTQWSLLFFALVAVLAYVRWRPPGTLRDLLIERPNFAAALTAVLVGGAISYFTEDSGVVVPALLLLFPAVSLVYLMLERKSEVGK